MAKKKKKTESVQDQEARKKAEAEAIAAAERAAAEAKAEAERRRAERFPKKVKRPRFVREQVEKRPAPKPPKPPVERSTTLRGKMMTKNLSDLPPDPLQPKGPGRI